MIYGSAYTDLILGEEGSDVIVGMEGDDLLLGGDDHDVLIGNYSDVGKERVKRLSQDTPDDIDQVRFSETHDAVEHNRSKDLGFPDLESFKHAGTSMLHVSKDGIKKAGNLSNSFVIEGARSGDELSYLIQIGDFNLDGFEDYLAYGNAKNEQGNGTDDHDVHMLYGPLGNSRLMRVEVSDDIEPSTSAQDLRVRGSDWSYEVTLNSDAERVHLKDQISAKGLCDVIVSNCGIPAAGQAKDGTILFTRFNGELNRYELVVVSGGKNCDVRTINIKKLTSPSEE